MKLQCYHQIYLEKQEIFVPCGRCYACRRKQAQDWQTRAALESQHWNYNYFVTLTYDEEHTDGYLHKEHVQKFLKRLRSQITYYNGKNERIKYFVVGEYGSHTHRPHYHLLLHSQVKLHSKVARHLEAPEILSAWKQGYVSIGSLSLASISYVTSYLHKQTASVMECTDDETRWNTFTFDKAYPNYRSTSLGYGLSYVTPKTIEYHVTTKRMCVTLPYSNGIIRRMPRYLREKVFSKEQITSIIEEYRNSERGKEVEKQVHLLLVMDIHERYVKAREQYIAHMKYCRFMKQTNNYTI